MKYLKWFLYLVGLLATPILVPISLKILIGHIICWDTLIIGPLTSFATIFFAYFAAPRYRALFAVCAFLWGYLLASIVIEPWYPECHPKAYEHSHLTLTATSLTGLLALSALLMRSWLNFRNPSPPGAQ